jgi:hypothetical protein
VVEQIEQLQAHLIDLGDALLWFVNRDVIRILRPAPGGSVDDEGLPRRARIAAQRLEMPPLAWHDLIREKPGTGAWESVLEALQADASAPIPE